MRQYNPCLIFLKIFLINIFFSHISSNQFLKHIPYTYFHRIKYFLFEINYFYSGLCHQGAFKLPSGKWLCVVNDEIKKDYYEGQQFCEDNGFERLFEVRSPEDSQFTNKLEFCE